MIVDHAADRAAASAWARAALADPNAVILDTETTDLWGYVVDLAVIFAATGEPIIDTLLDPGATIQPGAQRVHGITDAEVRGKLSFGDLLPELQRTLTGRRVLIWNADYDRGRIDAELTRLGYSPARPATLAASWECIMLQHAAWVGEWNDYHGNYRWHKLTGGDHRALGDCHAARRRLQETAESDAG